LDLDVPLDFSPLSLDQPLTTIASGVEVYIMDFLLTSSGNKDPTTNLYSRVSVVLKPYGSD
jgi:hypothetical protein